MCVKHLLLILVLITTFIGSVCGQTRKNIFLGIQPAITVEPFYEEGELDVNIFPLVFEMQIHERMNLRILPTVNYHVGGMENGLSDLGFYTVLPIFFAKNESADAKPFGFYVGPVFGFGRNLLNSHYTTTLAVEPGYMFEAKKSFTITLGVQLGSSHFAYDSQSNKWFFHWGPKVSFGFWLNPKNKN